MTTLLVWLLMTLSHPSFEGRWVSSLPPSINLETYRAAVKAAARPSFCKWNGPDTPCRVS
jgi:hypothetical protein